MLRKFESWINLLLDFLGKLGVILLILLLANVFYDVVARYLFNSVSIGLQEMEWHLYAALFLLGIPYTIRHDGHVRIDIFYTHLTPRRKALIDLFGTIFLLLPFALLIIYYTSDFSYQAYLIGEQSGDPGGLPYRWIIKAVTPFAFTAVVVAGIGRTLHSINVLRSDCSETDRHSRHLP